MLCRRFLSDDPETPYAPTFDFTIGTSLCQNINTDSLSKFLLKKEREVKKMPPSIGGSGKVTDGYTGLGKNSTTSRFQRYNVLSWDHPEIKKLKDNILTGVREYNIGCGNNTPDELYVRCWFNVMRFGQKIKPHMHSCTSNCYLTGHFNVQVNDTSTVYMYPGNVLNDPEVIDLKNKVGEMTLFPSNIFHYTTPHYSFKPRITIAFDVLCYSTDSNWEKLL